LAKITLYREYDGTVHELELPLSSKAEIGALAQELGVPSYVDLTNPVVQMALASLWASLNVPRLFNGPGDANYADRPLSPLLFGGAAVKLLCPSANAPQSPLNRPIKDIDFVVGKGEGNRFVHILLNLSRALGTRYHFFATKGDAMFNALRAGSRYRLRALLGVQNEEPLLTVTDIFVERVEMRHAIRLPQELFAAGPGLRYTIGPELLILTKAQFITDLDRKDLPQLEAAGQGFRVLHYPHYRQDKVLVGMEEKDLLDICALIVDGEAGGIPPDPERFSRLVGKDEKLNLTVRLNLENILRNAERLRAKGLSEGQLSKLEAGVQALLRALPPVDKKWSKPWWNVDVETPVIS